MSRQILSLGLVLSAASAAVAYTPLTDQKFNYPNGLPYQVDTDPTGRGPQFGFNQCNSTTEGQTSNCQTALLNSIGDFCMWGPADPNSLIANEEAKTVAWCTQPGHGARVIPSGTFSGIQVLVAPSYTLYTGHLKQSNINIQEGDDGGELDPHGDDQRGNPLGGLVYTQGFSAAGTGNTYTQVIEWHNFLGSDVFCFKICNPAVAGSKGKCNNVFDRTGCDFVAPAAYPDNVFEVCKSDDQDDVGVYTGADGQVSTYKQPAEGVPITSLPSVKTPSSSQCSTYSSASLYAAASSVTVSSSTSSGASSTTSSGASSTSTGSVASTSSKVSTSTSAASHSTSSTASSSSTSGGARAGAKVMSVEAIGLGPLAAVAVSVLAGLGAVLAGL